jgi:hypothetical protein
MGEINPSSSPNDTSFLASNPTVQEAMQHPTITRLVNLRMPEVID